MTHAEFVQSYRNGQAAAHVDRSLALQVMDTNLPAKRFQTAHLLWTWAWFLSFPVAIVLMIWVRWWVGLVVFVVGLMMPRAIKASAASFILEQALEDKEFYDAVTEMKVLIVKSL